MRAVIAVDRSRAAELSRDLSAEGFDVLAVFDSDIPAAASADRIEEGETAAFLTVLAQADVLILQVSPWSLTAALVGLCDRRGVRILPLSEAEMPLAAELGLEPAAPLDTPAWRLAEWAQTAPVPTSEPVRSTDAHQVIAVWGAAGSPGRTTIAIELARELVRGGRATILVDADSHAPSISLMTGLSDDGPGFAALCRLTSTAEAGVSEVERISQPLGRTGLRVLTGINRPSRWPELNERRVSDALSVCRQWARYTVVDVAAELERDEEIVSDLDGLRRNSATLATLAAADVIVAVVAGDPVGIARFLRGYSELRAQVGSARVAVLVNRVRPAAVGVDTRGQMRRTLERFAGITDVWFAPADYRAVDAALLAGRPIADVAPRSALSAAVRRFAGEAIDRPQAPPQPSPRASRRARKAARKTRHQRAHVLQAVE